MTPAGEQPVAPGELTYAEATAELDAIIAEFERSQVDVDRLADRFSRATELVEELDRRIRATRDHVQSLSPRLESVARAAEADPTAPTSNGSSAADDDERADPA